MGTRGPRPTPTKTLEARGSWRAKINTSEPRYPVERPDCPAVLSAEAKAEWTRQLDQLESIGLIALVDRAALAVWCEAWAEWSEAAKMTAGKKALVEGDLSPWLKIKQAAFTRLMRLAAEFGFTPSARSRLKAIETPAVQDATEAKYFGDTA